MSRHILLDSTPLGLLTKPTRSSAVLPIARWATTCLAAGHRIYVPEVIDYELRRELLRAGKSGSVTLLDAAKVQFRHCCSLDRHLIRIKALAAPALTGPR